MPTETAPQPQAAAPAAVPASPAPAAPVAETPINTVTGKPISAAAHSLFKMLEESQGPNLNDEPAQPEKTADAAEPKAPASPEAGAAPVATDKPVKVSKRQVKRPELPIPKEAPVASPAPAPHAPEANWEESLLDDERAALEDARFAEQANPKHKGLADKMGKFFREQKKYFEAHPDADENDADYQKVMALMPKLSATDKREIAEARIEDRVAKKHESKFSDLQQELYVRDEEPKVENEGGQIRKHLAFNALPEDMLKVLKEKGIAVLQKDYADELETAGNLINSLVDDSKELLRITRINPRTQRALGQIATDESNPKWAQHNRIAAMVNEACNDFQKNAPQAEQVRDGKWFVTREEWGKIPPASRHQFWTFTNSENHVREMINRAMGWMPDAINRSISARHDQLKSRGYVRQRADAGATTPPAAPPVATASVSSPRPAPAPAPSATPVGQRTAGQLLAARLAGE